MNREEWLERLADDLRERFTARAHVTPNTCRISCGYPPRGGQGKARKVLGVCCWNDEGDGVQQIFINPEIDDSIGVGGVVAHELGHCCFDFEEKHGPKFKKALLAIGIEKGKAASMLTPGEDLEKELALFVKRHGEYPQHKLVPTGKDKKQTTRMRKLVCAANETHAEDYIVRASAKVIAMGLPVCPCGLEMVLEEKEDEDKGGYKHE
jgi:hypothetical protein